jgi:hypothetical protein
VRYLARGLHLSTDSNFMLFEPLHETTRLSATEQVNDTVTTLYFEREPFAEIDSDFFDDEEEESDNIKILRKLVAPSNPLRETNRRFEVDVAVMQDAVEVFESDYSSTVESELVESRSHAGWRLPPGMLLGLRLASSLAHVGWQPHVLLPS